MVTFLAGVFVGALLGTFAGLFFAAAQEAARQDHECPQPQETRDEYIKRKAQERD